MEMSGNNQSFIDAFDRLHACFEIMHRIKAKGERVLVFIDHRKIQFRFVKLARQKFGLEHIDHITVIHLSKNDRLLYPDPVPP
ncbi:hypothetical protein [Pantoea sp. App145]|uniref:hypothetical protein n=1 Tax=Pantoea sp. App145 TaxID=3071567 RepID=UPI003A80E39E